MSRLSFVSHERVILATAATVGAIPSAGHANLTIVVIERLAQVYQQR